MLIDIVKKINKFEPNIRDVLLDILNEVEAQRKQQEQTVTKVEFNELKEIVRELAEAQKQTEKKIEELAEAQRKTEERMISLEQKIEELAEAQRKTEERMISLEQKMEELAEAQRKTEIVVKGLVKDMADVKIRLDGLSDSVGYGIEDKLIPLMPQFIKNRYGFELKVVDRRNIVYSNGKFDEINIYIEARNNKKDCIIIGECKAKPGKKDVNKFLKLKQRVEKYSGKDVLAFMVGYSYHPEVEQYLNKLKELDFYKTYEIERIAT